MVTRRIVLAILFLVVGLPLAVQAQSAAIELIDVPVGGNFVITVPADWFLWTGEPIVTAQQEERANASATIMVQSVYPSLTIPTTFARQFRQLIALPSTPPEQGVVYMLVEIVPVTDLMLVANANESAITTAGLLRAINAQLLTTMQINGRTASLGINRSGNDVTVVATYRFPIEGQLAVVKVFAPDAWLSDNVALVRLLVTTLRRVGEDIDELAYQAFAGEPIPETLRLPSDEPAPVPTFDLNEALTPAPTATADPRVQDVGILPTPTLDAPPPPTPAPTVIPASPTQPVVPLVNVARPVPGGQYDANGRCIIPEGWRQYVVQPGDTLFRVAVNHGSSIAEMRDANCIRNVDFLPWGTIIYVPGTPWGTTGGPAPATNEPPPPAPSNLFAQGCTDSSTLITAPFAGQQVSGQFAIVGTASLPNMNYYKIEVRPNFSEVYNYVGQSNEPVVNGTLARINSRVFGTGLHWIRLTVVDDTGNFPTPCTVPVIFN